MAITQVQAPVQVTGTTNPLVYTFGATPTAGNIIIVCGSEDLASQFSISDSIGDSGGAKTAWATVLSDKATVGSNRFYSMAWRVIGNSPSGNTVSLANPNVGSLEIDVGEYSSSDSGTWGVDGTPVSATGTSTAPNGGNITVTGNAVFYVRGVTVGGGSMTAGTGFTRNFTGAPGANREAQEWAEFSATTHATGWTMAASADWLVLAAAFSKSSGSSFNPGRANATSIIGGVF